jgi:hypothetical protein
VRKAIVFYIQYNKLLFILPESGYLHGGNGTTIRHYTQITDITQNNTTIKRNTVHRTAHTINTLHTMNTTITTTIIMNHNTAKLL